mgnify:CR=1 FL=1
MMLYEGTKNRDDLVAENTGSAGEIKVNSEDSVGMLASNSVANNKKKINIGIRIVLNKVILFGKFICK